MVTFSCCPSSLCVFGLIVPKGKVVDDEVPVVVALLRRVVEVASVETVKVNVVATAAVTLTPFTIAIRVSVVAIPVPETRTIYEPVVVAFVMPAALEIASETVPEGKTSPAHAVKVRALVLVANVTLFEPPAQADTIVIPVEVTFVRLTPAMVPNALVRGSSVYVIVWVGRVEVGFVKTMV